MAEDSEVIRLRRRVVELEKKLAAVRRSGEVVKRTKIDKMSSEVVDSNPYRYKRTAITVLTHFTVTIVRYSALAKVFLCRCVLGSPPPLWEGEGLPYH